MNSEQAREYSRKYYTANREEILRYMADYRKNNREAYNAYFREYYKAHKQEILKKRKESYWRKKEEQT